MKKMWKYRNYPGDVIDITPNLNSNLIHGGRGNEIKEWLKNKKNITNYAIVDDDDFDILPEQFPYLVKTSGNTNHTDYVDLGYGLTKECSQQIINILNNEKNLRIT
jgi:hypothetical protein